MGEDLDAIGQRIRGAQPGARDRLLRRALRREPVARGVLLEEGTAEELRGLLRRLLRRALRREPAVALPLLRSTPQDASVRLLLRALRREPANDEILWE